MKLVDDIVYEVEARMITKKGNVEVDIGANASAEEAEEALDENTTQVIDFVESFRLTSTSFDKKSYLTYLKGYMKRIKGKLAEKGSSEEEIKEFETGASNYAKKIVANFKDYEFYIGESMLPDGMVLLLNYREDGVTPFFTIWKHGLIAQKV
ncbi:MAG: hypothetical protein M1829_004007 [Trizodia sp. TS-e1964]|nr:MAG: hypothetical protein M1829_004007 [Trizodia sp. TS-e1964]